jgi:hypothetical protein
MLSWKSALLGSKGNDRAAWKSDPPGMSTPDTPKMPDSYRENSDPGLRPRDMDGSPGYPSAATISTRINGNLKNVSRSTGNPNQPRTVISSLRLP